MAVGVFISYNHADIKIATALKQCLRALSGDINVFIDHAGLVAGDEYEPTLARNIAASQWFLMICSGPPRPERDMGWCLIEAGQFRAKLLNENRENMIRSRLVSVHDDARPRPLAQFESIKISPFDRLNRRLDLRAGSDDNSKFEATDAFKLFDNIVVNSTKPPLLDMSDDEVRSRVREQARILTRAFVDFGGDPRLPEVVLQPRISFLLPPLNDGGVAALSNEIPVMGYDSSLKDIFGIAGAETNWGSIKLQVKEADGNDPLWITDVEQAALKVSNGLIPEQPEGLCLSVLAKGFYRVLFARYEPFKSGARICYIVFIPSRAKQFDVRKRSSILLSALILSIRFRQKVLPFIETIRTAAQGRKMDVFLTLERVVHLVETEAIAFGLNMGSDDEELPLLQVIRDGHHKAFFEDSIKSWGESRNAMMMAVGRIRGCDSDAARAEATAEAEMVIVGALERTRMVNGKFIELLAEELLFIERIESDEPPVQPS